MDLLIDPQAETAHLTPETVPDQITQTTVTPATIIHITDRDTKETTTEIGDTNTTQDKNKETRTTKTGMITIKIETGLTKEGDRTNTNTTETDPKHKSSSDSQTRI